MGTSLVERDNLVGNLLDRIDELERRIRYMEDTHPGIGGEAAGKLAYYREDGSLHMPGLLYSEENMVWGYYDRLIEVKTIADATVGSNLISHTGVPAGEVWVMYGVAIRDNATASPARCWLYDGVTYHPLFDFGALTADTYKTFLPGHIVLKAGDRICVEFTACALHDILYSEIWGYKMQVV